MKKPQWVKSLFFYFFIIVFLHACDSDDHQSTIGAPRQVANVDRSVYQQIFQSPSVNALFAGAGITRADQVPCDVKVHRISFNTLGGAGEATTSSGVFMQPAGDNPGCSGPRPVVLYAHGTNPDKNYDLSQFVADLATQTNPATSEALSLLAIYASQGYAVIAPNYAGYADSTLEYHPYIDEKQQSTEMIDALNHVRSYQGIIGASLSSDLFVTGVSQGGYVAMATHKALEAQGETVTASLPISGPYAVLDFLDTVMQGYVNRSANIFAPMYLTALDKANDIYTDPNEVYDPAYAAIADNIYPKTGGDTGTLPEALFSGIAPTIASSEIDVNYLGAGFSDTDHLLADELRQRYLDDITNNGDNPVDPIRSLVKQADLRNWIPQAPLMMCGSNNDPTVYHRNANLMADHWSRYVTAGLVINLDLEDPSVAFEGTPLAAFGPVLDAWKGANIDTNDIHAKTGVYCGFAGNGFFKSLSSVPVAVSVASSVATRDLSR